MQVESKFYEKLHSENANYGADRYVTSNLLSSKPFRAWMATNKSKPVRILEIACGKGQFLLDVTQSLSKDYAIGIERIAALDLVKAEPNVLDQIAPIPEFTQQTVDGQPLPYKNGEFHLVTCNHVLEHVFETEAFVREIRRVTAPTGLAVISVPNCAAWMNRILFFFGTQPLGSEVGTESITYGFWPRVFQGHLSKFRPSGHIRDFTPRSLKDLTTHCGFKHAGWWAQNGGPFPTLVRRLGIVLQPA